MSGAPLVILGYNNTGTRLGCGICDDPLHEKALVGVEYRTPAGEHVCQNCGGFFADEPLPELYRFLWRTGLADAQLWGEETLAQELAAHVNVWIEKHRGVARDAENVSW